MSADGAAVLWNLDGPRPPTKSADGDDRVTSIAFAPGDARLLVTAVSSSNGDSSSIRIWGLEKRNPVPLNLWQSQPATPLTALAFWSGSRFLTSTGDDGTILRWDLNEPFVAPITVGHHNRSNTLASMPAGDFLASADPNGAIRLWVPDQRTSSPVVLLLPGFPDLTSLVFSADGESFVSAHKDGTIRQFRRDDPWGDSILRAEFSGLRSLASGPAGEVLVFREQDGTILMDNLDDSEAEPTRLGEAEGVRSLAFAPSGNLFASGGDDGTIRLRDLDETNAAPLVLESAESVLSLAITQDGEFLASVGRSGTIRLWNLTTSSAGPVELVGHKGTVYSVCLLDGRATSWLLPVTTEPSACGI